MIRPPCGNNIVGIDLIDLIGGLSYENLRFAGSHIMYHDEVRGALFDVGTGDFREGDYIPV